MSSPLKEIVVVYAEDELGVREQVSKFLGRRVKAIYEALNGKEGLELIKEHDPDLVITDLEMPVMNGIAMIEKIRELHDHKKPILVLTGYDDNEHYTDLADAYIYKPIDLRKLEEVIITLIQQYKS